MEAQTGGSGSTNMFYNGSRIAACVISLGMLAVTTGGAFAEKKKE
jgi:hypothetical protein